MILDYCSKVRPIWIIQSMTGFKALKMVSKELEYVLYDEHPSSETSTAAQIASWRKKGQERSSCDWS